ncbi:hypothetical protein NC653_004812 [Populus alba x Populus x berolinensis]|uniref:Uncharacterized protein n=1 Tax=Populus alba x Populus x berolinensis TaxID=444605 RepID=A0AAD6WNW7_9ROSI|nr:hypothetical protein NC653_004812 [Populus alba x Populus x berolinensis]
MFLYILQYSITHLQPTMLSQLNKAWLQSCTRALEVPRFTHR